MRELNVNEIEVVNGGLVFAVVGFAASFAGNFAARSLISFAVSRAGFIAGGVGVLQALDERRTDND